MKKQEKHWLNYIFGVGGDGLSPADRKKLKPYSVAVKVIYLVLFLLALLKSFTIPVVRDIPTYK
jgi:hypothetical protein